MKYKLNELPGDDMLGYTTIYYSVYMTISTCLSIDIGVFRISLL